METETILHRSHDSNSGSIDRFTAKTVSQFGFDLRSDSVYHSSGPNSTEKFEDPWYHRTDFIGAIIGPHGLGWIEKNAAVDLISTVGLLYIMFLAGLELDLKEFRTNKHKSLVFGLYTFLIPMAIGFPVCRFLIGLDFNASLLVASMFSTHTLVTYPIVSRMGISRHEAVAITVVVPC